MLSANEILKTLRRLKKHLSKYGVSSVGVFGSSVRGDAGPDSDIDILLDFQSGQEIIGEATKKIPADVKYKWSDISWKNMAGMRDRLIHDYME